MSRLWTTAIMLLIASALASWAWAIHEVDQLERQVRRIEPGLVVIRPTPALRDSLDACHRRLDVIAGVIEVIERRRGNEPPRTLDEARRYRWAPPDRFVPGTGEVSK